MRDRSSIKGQKWKDDKVKDGKGKCSPSHCQELLPGGLITQRSACRDPRAPAPLGPGPTALGLEHGELQRHVGSSRGMWGAPDVYGDLQRRVGSSKSKWRAPEACGELQRCVESSRGVWRAPEACGELQRHGESSSSMESSSSVWRPAQDSSGAPIL
ncbi:unnamed protein product [Coccothraustes coccothraustes]